jgi:hypothetical protein
MAAYSCCARHSTKIAKAARQVAATAVSAFVGFDTLYEALESLFFLRGEYISVPYTHRAVRPYELR